MVRLTGCIIIFELVICNVSRGQQSPQIYSNLFLSLEMNDNWTLRNEVSYNFLFSDKFHWNEFSISSMGAKQFHKHLEFVTGLYISRVQQNSVLSSTELRGVTGLRIFSNNERRFLASNYARLEFRYLLYSDNKNTGTIRARNRTSLLFSINQKSINSSNNLFALGYFDAFYNFEDNVRERFFKQFKIKLGLGYRSSLKWAVDVGVIYLDFEDNVGENSNLPLKIDTNYIIEWRISYLISQRLVTE